VSYDPWSRPTFDDVYRAERGSLVQLAFLLVGSRRAAEELTQDAFARLYQHFGQQQDPVAFVRTSLVRACANWRAPAPSPTAPLDLTGEPGPTGQPDLDETWAALGRLPAERRVVTVLRDHLGLTVTQAAAALGCSPSVVQSRSRRALADLGGGDPADLDLRLHRTMAAKAALIDPERPISGRWAEGYELAAYVPRFDVSTPRPRRTPVVVTLVAVATVLVVLLVAFAVLGGSSSSSSNSSITSPTDVPTTSDPAQVEQVLESVPPSAFEAVRPNPNPSVPRPLVVAGAPLVLGGKPEVLFAGLEWCPFCASERWGLALALMRFGHLSGIGVIHSSEDDVFPGTPSISFYGSQYTSPWISFVGREMEDVDHRPLDPLSSSERALFEAAGGTTPFIDLGGRYRVTGTGVDPGLLEGRSALDVARAITDSSSDIGQAVLGEADRLTAAMCELTHGQPRNVCDTPGIAQLQRGLGH
jgi:DNA-directed RNA polymerase specialized sigma24 family protein